MKHICTVIAASTTLLLGVSTTQAQTNPLSGVTFASLQRSAAHARVIGLIKARLADNKDIKGRYIRARCDENGIQLAGFVPDEATGEAALHIAQQAATSATVRVYWTLRPELADAPIYKTYVEEQATDLALEAKVRAQLLTPDVELLLKNATVVAVDAVHGHVTIYLAIDAPPETIDLSPHFTGLHGLNTLTCLTVKTY